MSSAHQRSRFLQECLKRTNEHRLRHGVAVLTLNSELSSISQNWADQLLRSNRLSHNPKARYLNSSLGENVAYNFKSGSEVSGSEMIDQWYNEINDYSFNAHSGRKVTGHFTQLVWKSSREVGFGLAASNGHHYLVANYYPPGNYVGQNRENVFPPQDEKMKAGGVMGFGANKISPITTPRQATYLPQTVHQKHSIFDEFKSTVNDKNVRTRPTIKIETKTFHERPKEGGTKSTTDPGVTTVHVRNCPGKLETWKQNFFDLTNRFTASVGFHDDGNHCVESNSFKYTTKHSMPDGTLFVTERFHEPRSRVTSSKTHVTTCDEKTSVQKFPAVRMLREPEGRQSSSSSLERSFASSVISSTNRQTHRDFQDEVLTGHNKYRMEHQVGNLTINANISRLAQQWADKLAGDEEMELSGNKYLGQQLGESVAYKYSSIEIDYTGSELMDNWYKEKDDYNFKYPNERFKLDKIGHFTQMVWKDSKEIGIGKSWSKDGRKVFVVCNYFPVGNVIGCFTENVFHVVVVN